MRLQLLSDLHFEFHADGGRSFVESLDPAGIDVLVLAGDIAVGAGIPGALALFCERYAGADVVYVHGNHEYYGTNRESVVRWTKEASSRHSNLSWLDSELVEIRGRRFLGGPLWFAHAPEGDRVKQFMGDFSAIERFESWVYDENRRMTELLARELREGDVVITHHLPSHRCVAPRYVGNALNVFFLCDVEDLIEDRRPSLWFHGHTHEQVDVRVGETRVLCNPFGYVGYELNHRFDERLRVELPD
jgi:predicted phosphodiesterase